jgi:hypothetical protein
LVAYSLWYFVVVVVVVGLVGVTYESKLHGAAETRRCSLVGMRVSILSDAREREIGLGFIAVAD